MSKELPSVLPRNRSRSPLARLSHLSSNRSTLQKSPSHNHTQSKLHPRKLQASGTDALIQRLGQNRQNLCACFDIYELLFQNGVPQRCVLHNNFVTLYCEDQQKLLCVNCVYGSVKHQAHRVIPIKNCFDNIQEDNSVNQKRLSQVVESLDSLYTRTFQTVQLCKTGLDLTLKSLNEQYDTIQRMLVSKFQQTREGIIQRYSQLSSKSQALEKQICWLRDTYVQRQKNLPTSGEEPTELYKHMLFNTMLDPEKVDIRPIEPLNTEDLRQQLLSEIIQIRTFLDTGKHKSKKHIL